MAPEGSWRWKHKHRMALLAIFSNFKIASNEVEEVFASLFQDDIQASGKGKMKWETIKNQYAWRNSDKSASEDGWEHTKQIYQDDGAARKRYAAQVAQAYTALFGSPPETVKDSPKKTGAQQPRDDGGAKIVTLHTPSLKKITNEAPDTVKDSHKKARAQQSRDDDGDTIIVTPHTPLTKKISNDRFLTPETNKRKGEDIPFMPNKSPSRKSAVPGGSNVRTLSAQTPKTGPTMLTQHKGRLPLRVYRVFSAFTPGQNSPEHGFLATSFVNEADIHVPYAPRDIVELQAFCKDNMSDGKSASPYVAVFASFASALAHAVALDLKEEEEVMISEITTDQLDSREAILSASENRKIFETTKLRDFQAGCKQFFVFHHINHEAVSTTYEYTKLKRQLADSNTLEVVSALAAGHDHIRDDRGKEQLTRRMIADALARVLALQGTIARDSVDLVADELGDLFVKRLNIRTSSDDGVSGRQT